MHSLIASKKVAKEENLPRDRLSFLFLFFGGFGERQSSRGEVEDIESSFCESRVAMNDSFQHHWNINSHFLSFPASQSSASELS